jgi:hypothetical protein
MSPDPIENMLVSNETPVLIVSKSEVDKKLLDAGKLHKSVFIIWPLFEEVKSSVVPIELMSLKEFKDM